MREFRIRLRDAAFDGLVDRALRERRAPGEQAAYMLERSLLRTKAAAREPLTAGADPQPQTPREAGDGR